MTSNKEKIPDAEVIAEEKHEAKETVETVNVLYPPPKEAPVRVRVESRSRHPLKVECFEIDEDGYIDIVVSDADN